MRTHQWLTFGVGTVLVGALTLLLSSLVAMDSTPRTGDAVCQHVVTTRPPDVILGAGTIGHDADNAADVSYWDLAITFRKAVRLVGYLVVGPDREALYESREVYLTERTRGTVPGVWWRPASRAGETSDGGSGEVPFDLSHRCARVEGQFSSVYSGVGDLTHFAGELVRVSRLEVWLAPYRPAAFVAPAPPSPPLPDSPRPFGALDVSGVTTRPVVTKKVQPVYPDDARALKVQGAVLIDIVVGTDGRVLYTKVIRSIPSLDAAALDAVRQWEFSPGAIGDVPVPVMMMVMVLVTPEGE